MRGRATAGSLVATGDGPLPCRRHVRGRRWLEACGRKVHGVRGFPRFAIGATTPQGRRLRGRHKTRPLPITVLGPPSTLATSLLWPLLSAAESAYHASSRQRCLSRTSGMDPPPIRTASTGQFSTNHAFRVARGWEWAQLFSPMAGAHYTSSGNPSCGTRHAERRLWPSVSVGAMTLPTRGKGGSVLGLSRHFLADAH